MRHVRLGLGFALSAAVLGLADAGTARAASFDVIRSAPDMVTLIDREAVVPVGAGKVRRARSVSVQKNLVSGGPQQPGYVTTLNDYDCEQWTIRWSSFSVYSRFGDLVLHKDNPDPTWMPIAGNFEAEAGARIVCDGREAGRVYAASSIGSLVLALMKAWDAETPMPPLQPVQPLPKAPKQRDKAAAQR
jgi:hypothetical protein